MGKYRDFDALSFKSRVHGDDDREHVNHVTKKSMKDGSKQQGEVKFDPEQHKEFITGFRKRKQQRRLKAIKELEVKARKERLQFRAEKREKLKNELGVADDWGLDDDKGDTKKQPGVQPGEKKVYQAQGVTTTVSIVALDSEDDNPEEEEEEEGERERASFRAEDFPSSSSMRPKKWRPQTKAIEQDEKQESKGKHQALTANTRKLQALQARKKKGGVFKAKPKGAKSSSKEGKKGRR